MPGPWSVTDTVPFSTTHAHRSSGRIPLDRVVDQITDRVIDCRRINVDQAGVQLGVDERLWGVLSQAAHRVVGK